MKYIHHAYHGQEQLFDLDKDPHEVNDLAGDPKAESELRTWRNRMVEHLSIRGRPVGEERQACDAQGADPAVT